jgi:hypothetical protein
MQLRERGLINVRRSRPAGSDSQPFTYFENQARL